MSEYHEDNEEDYEMPSWTPPKGHTHRAREISRTVAQWIVVGSFGVIIMMLSVIFLQVWGVDLFPAALIGGVLTVISVPIMVKITDRI